MSYQIDADYTKTFLFPPSLEDFVPSDDPSRFIRAFVDSLDLSQLDIHERNSEDGRPNYSPRLLLKIWLYGWFDGVKSSRALERLCRRDLGLLWLTGMNYPDHNSLWRFYRTNRCSLKKLFKHSVRIAMKNDLIGMVLHALDGTKITANANRHKELSRKRLEKQLRQVEEIIEKYMQTIESSSEAELPSDRLPEELQDANVLKERIENDLGQLKERGLNNSNTTDVESRLMRTREGTTSYSYNAQGVADLKSGIMVSADVTQAENDSHQLNRQLEEVESTVGECAETTVADSGYFSGEELSSAEERSRTVLVDIPRHYNENSIIRTTDSHHINNYTYDRSTDSFICPRGGRLEYKRDVDRKNHRNAKEYVCTNFKDCPYKKECTRSDGIKRITTSKYHESIRRQLKKHQISESQRLLSLRKTMIEPVFGIIKEQLKLRRFLYRGLDNARSQWYLVCSIYNLRKIFKLCGSRVQFN